MRCVFITGTDTNAGKTYRSVKLLQELNQAGFSTLGLKPVASGSERDPNGELKNDDALKLQVAASVQIPYSALNPFVFESPIAPHIAADLTGISLSARKLAETTLQTLKKYPADIAVIEGAGGWFLPLNTQETMVDYLAILSREVDLEILLVVGMKLGCLNHALLTMNAIETFTHQNSARFLGWIPSFPQGEMPYLEQNLEFLSRRYLLVDSILSF